MKIAFFCSSRNIIPPHKTGGIEWATFFLAKELARRGHKITLYAAHGSKVKGVKVKEISPFPTLVKQKYANLSERITSFYDLSSFADFFANGEDKKFDVIHITNYIFYEILPFAQLTHTPILVEICYPHDNIYPYLKNNLSKNRNIHYLPGSRFIRSAMPDLAYLPPLYPAVDESFFPFSKKVKNYLFFIGRICPEKGVHLAIEAARLAKKKLVIAGGVRETNLDYFQEFVKPQIDGKNIIYMGEVDLKTRVKLYQGALALLFPIQWNEPCGNVMIESMMCGTPVIAFDRAAAREIVKNNFTGIVVGDGKVNDMAKAIALVGRLDRKKIRQYAIEKFSIGKEAAKYEKICLNLLKQSNGKIDYEK